MNTSSNGTGSGCSIVGFLIILLCCIGPGVITFFEEASPQGIAITLSLLFGPIILFCIISPLIDVFRIFLKKTILVFSGLVFVIWLFIVSLIGWRMQAELNKEREYEQLDYSRPDPWSAPRKGESSEEYLLRLDKHLLEEEKRKNKK